MGNIAIGRFPLMGTRITAAMARSFEPNRNIVQAVTAMLGMVPPGPATTTTALQDVQAMLAAGWRPVLSMRNPDGSINWSTEGAIQRACNKRGVPQTDLRATLQAVLIERGADSPDNFEAAPGRTQADVVTVLSAALDRYVEPET